MEEGKRKTSSAFLYIFCRKLKKRASVTFVLLRSRAYLHDAHYNCFYFTTIDAEDYAYLLVFELFN